MAEPIRPCPECNKETAAGLSDARIEDCPDGSCLIDCPHCGTRLRLDPSRRNVRVHGKVKAARKKG